MQAQAILRSGLFFVLALFFVLLAFFFHSLAYVSSFSGVNEAVGMWQQEQQQQLLTDERHNCYLGATIQLLEALLNVSLQIPVGLFGHDRQLVNLDGGV